MIWLQSAPWGRWILSGALACLALWIELRPDPTVEHPFATTRIEVGELITPANTELKRVPASLFEPIDEGASASVVIPTGAPIHPTDTADVGSVIPLGWWVVATAVPVSARTGDDVQIVLLDTGEVVGGVVVSASVDDSFSVNEGGVAVESTNAVAVAQAAAADRIAVLVSTS